MNSENVLKGFVVLAFAGAAAYFRELLGPVAVLLAVMVLDYITGMIEAWVNREMSSRVGVVGIIKKVGYLAVVAVAVVADWVIQEAAGKAGLDAGGINLFGLIVTVWLILNECISILENLAEIGVPLPEFLVALVKRLKKSAEDKGGGSPAEK
ncbi:MAG: phage holin family protein [Oscillospiraceae bacterium]|nr:phage holin family protein [Oscillospiraceae bacterium]